MPEPHPVVQKLPQSSPPKPTEGSEAFPSRPGAPVCDFYARTGHCKFGQGCKFDHPLLCAPYPRLLAQACFPLRNCQPCLPVSAEAGACERERRRKVEKS